MSSTVSSAPILVIANVSKRFGGLQALTDVSLTIKPGQITGVIGPNGSGKSTLFNTVTGIVQTDSGHIRFRDVEISHAAPDHINRLGIGRTFQLTRLFGQMTAFENLVVVGRGSRAEARERAEQLLDLVSLRHLQDEYAANLSYGQQKLVEFIRLMMTDPSLVMLDEPFAGVNPTMERRLLEQIERWLENGMTVVVTDHEMKIMMDICHELVVLDYGEVIAHGEPSAVRADPRVMEAYFGR
ncbi:MAG TPA: ABC transporter ATP-binding protein [Thermomicrobiales bacterium]|nr:ABC transporter ATP-binding protein [Thermomicrobiales bacterium]